MCSRKKQRYVHFNYIGPTDLVDQNTSSWPSFVTSNRTRNDGEESILNHIGHQGISRERFQIPPP